MKKLIFIALLSSLMIILTYISFDLCREFLQKKYACTNYTSCKTSFIEKHEFLSLFVHTRHLEKITNDINKQPTLHDKFQLAIEATQYANEYKTLYLSSDTIENVFTHIAEQNDIELYSEVIPNSVLHVASEVYTTGGHSRVIERWIETSPENEIHSVILTRESVIPERMEKAVKQKHGQILFLNRNTSDINAALELRKIASQYEKIVLHIHMDDYIPLIAFGTKKFPRPVILFNHADHRFWVGVSIADYIVELRPHGKMLTSKFRGSNLNSIIELPLDVQINTRTFDQVQNRILFDLPLDRPIVFTSGSPYKFQPKGNLDYSLFMKKILKHRKDVFFVLVGPSKGLFKNFSDIPEQNYRFFDIMPNAEYIKCLSTADVVIDSMPICGFLTLVDAVSMNIPVLTVKRNFPPQEFIMRSKACVPDIDSLVVSTLEILKSKEKQTENITNVKTLLEKVNDPILYQEQIHDVYKKLKSHSVHPFESKKVKYKTMMF